MSLDEGQNYLSRVEGYIGLVIGVGLKKCDGNHSRIKVRIDL